MSPVCCPVRFTVLPSGITSVRVTPVRVIKGYITVPLVAVAATVAPELEYEMVFDVTADTVCWPSKRASAGLNATNMTLPTTAVCPATVIVAVVVVADLLVGVAVVRGGSAFRVMV